MAKRDKGSKAGNKDGSSGSSSGEQSPPKLPKVHDGMEGDEASPDLDPGKSSVPVPGSPVPLGPAKDDPSVKAAESLDAAMVAEITKAVQNSLSGTITEAIKGIIPKMEQRINDNTAKLLTPLNSDLAEIKEKQKNGS